MSEQANSASLPPEVLDTITKTSDPAKFVNVTLNGQLSEYTPDSASVRQVNLITAACANELSVRLNRKQYRVSQEFLGTRPLAAIAKHFGDTEFDILHFKARSTETPPHLILESPTDANEPVLSHISFEYFCMINVRNKGQQGVRFTISILAKSGQNEVTIEYIASPLQILESMQISPSELSLPHTRAQLTSTLSQGTAQNPNNGVHTRVLPLPTQRNASPRPSNGTLSVSRKQSNLPRTDRPIKFIRTPRSKRIAIRPADDAPDSNAEISSFLHSVSQSWNPETCFKYSYVFDTLTLLENISTPLRDLFMTDPDLHTLPSHMNADMYEFFRIAQPLLVALMTRGMTAVEREFIEHNSNIPDVEISDIESEPHEPEIHDDTEACRDFGDGDEGSKEFTLGSMENPDGKNRDAFS